MEVLSKHKDYLKHKDDPLVILLLKTFESSGSSTIPKVWQDYIRKTTADSDLTVLRARMRKLKIQMPADDSIRGASLFEFLSGNHYSEIFEQTSEYWGEGEGGLSWPESLMWVLRSRGCVPKASEIKTATMACVNVTMDLTYMETGTVEYRVTRRIPRTVVSIPSQWILENCGPKFSDDDVMRNFVEGQRLYFTVKGEGKSRANGLWVKEQLGRLLASFTPRDLFDTNTLTSLIQRVFNSARVRGAQWDDEQQCDVILTNVTPSKLKFGTDVSRRSVGFDFCQSRRGSRRQTTIVYPQFTYPNREKLSMRNIYRPSARTIYEMTPFQEDVEQGENPSKYFIEALRKAYNSIYRPVEFKEGLDNIKK